MNKAMKAFLLSALVFPGIGHFYLKKTVQGTLLSGIALISLYYLVSTVLEITQQLSAKIQSGEIPLDITKINEVVSQHLAEANGLVNIPSLILLLCWLVGIADSYRVGRAQDQKPNTKNKKT